MNNNTLYLVIKIRFLKAILLSEAVQHKYRD